MRRSKRSFFPCRGVRRARPPGPVASIPAPEERSAGSARLPEPPPIAAREPERQPIAAPELPPPIAAEEPEQQPIAASQTERPSMAVFEAEPEPMAAPEPEPQPIAAPEPEPQPIAAPEPEPQPIAEAKPEPQPIAAAEPEQVTSLVPFSPPEALPSIDEIRRRRSEKFQTEPRVHPHFAYEVPGKGANLRLAAVLLVAAALGCAVGYWAYLQLPSATIPLNVRAQSAALLVSWPTGETRDAVYAAMRIDDGQQVPLTPEERSSGRAKITPASDNVKIEVIARHWMRDSRGIIRYMKAAPALQAQSPVSQ